MAAWPPPLPPIINQPKNLTVTKSRLKLVFLTLAAISAVPGQAAYLFNTKFNSGRVPAVMTAVDRDGEPLSTSDYRVGFTTDGWTVGMVTGGQYAALSPSHTRTQVAQSNLLSCPAVTVVGERPMLRWNGRSIHPSCPEAYRVLVQEKESESAVTVFETSAEDDQWRTRAVDLTPWMGKEIIVSFECVSVNKYLLGIDDVYIGDPEEVNYKGFVTTPEYVGLAWGYPGQEEGSATVRGRVENMGMPLASGRIVCMSGGNEIASMPLEREFRCGDSLDFAFDVPVRLDQPTPYTIEVEDAEGNRTVAVENRVFCSWFPRTHLVDEFTGLWCNKCPEGLLEVERLERRFGSQMVALSVHVNDVLECAEYRKNSTVYSVPWLMLNRDSQSGGSSTSGFESGYDIPTEVFIEISKYELSEGGVSAEAQVTWAKDVDNSGDRYRVGYVLARDVVTEQPDRQYNQSNGLGTVRAERFYYLGTSVNSDLSPVYNSVVSGEYAHAGLPGSLPSAMSAMEPVTARWNVSKPEGVEDLGETRLVAYVLDCATGKVMNACSQRLNEAVVSICPPSLSAGDPCLDEEYYTIDGIRVNRPAKGLYIVRKGSQVRKIMF